MTTTAKISISLPKDVLERAERERRETGESRSELFRRALEALFERHHHEAAVRRYVEGYLAEPETEYEVASTGAVSPAAFEEDEDWD